jgi:hypothetical protein
LPAALGRSFACSRAANPLCTIGPFKIPIKNPKSLIKCSCQQGSEFFVYILLVIRSPCGIWVGGFMTEQAACPTYPSDSDPERYDCRLLQSRRGVCLKNHFHASPGAPPAREGLLQDWLQVTRFRLRIYNVRFTACRLQPVFV